MSIQEVRVGYALLKGSLHKVKYVERNGLAIYQGDIILGTAEDIKHITEYLLEHPGHIEQFGAHLATGTWPKNSVNICIIDDAPNQNEIRAAIDHWNQNTTVKIRDMKQGCHLAIGIVFDPMPISFMRGPAGSACSSPIGYQHDGRARIQLTDGCHFGQIVHEIGHTVGLFHEQSRPDRDQYVEILYDNIIESERHNFDISPAAVPSGPYDYGSIMHYGAYDFSKSPGVLPTIRVKQPGVQIGQRNGLSPGDIAAVKAMYP